MLKTEFAAKYGIEDPKVFLDSASRPYLVGKWHGKDWLFYWHPDNRWVSLRKVSDGPMLFVDYLPEDQQAAYFR